MPLTPVSGSVSYCSPAAFLQRFDVRTIGDWLGDQGLRLDPTLALTSATLGALLQEASGELESRTLRGNRYQVADLQALMVAGGNGAAYLAGIVGGWTVYLAWRRRIRQYAEQDLPVAAQQSVEAMTALQEGEQVLPFAEAAQSGLERFHVVTERDIVNRRGAAVIARPYFGWRGADYSERGPQGN